MDVHIICGVVSRAFVAVFLEVMLYSTVHTVYVSVIVLSRILCYFEYILRSLVLFLVACLCSKDTCFICDCVLESMYFIVVF
jgi:hypothetical protein